LAAAYLFRQVKEASMVAGAMYTPGIRACSSA
jgi:hypothetical protein